MRRQTPALFVVLLIVLAGSAQAATYVVDHAGSGDYLTIGEALAIAVGGDVVQVLPGTYAESVVVGEAVTLQSTAGSASTVISGPDSNTDVVTVDADGAALQGFRLSGGRYGLAVSAGVTALSISDTEILDTGRFLAYLPPHIIESVVPALTLTGNASGQYNAVRVFSGTIAASTTWPALPTDVVYYLESATVSVVGAAGPVLTIPSGVIVKSWFSRFEIGSGSQPGGLVADDVTFTSAYDDVGGDTNGGAQIPAAGQWQRLDFNAAARSDSCLVTNCELRYGGSGDGVIQVAGSTPTVSGCTFSDNVGAIYVTAVSGDCANLTGNTVNQGESHPFGVDLGGLDNLVFGNTIVPRGDGAYNGIRIFSSTVAESRSLPTLPHGFVYYLVSVTISVVDASGPVLTIPSGTIIKSWFTRFEIGSAVQPGGLVADGVTFTSAYDDIGGDTNGGAQVPAAGQWQRLDFNAQARADSCLITNCEFRYGGSGDGVIQVAGSTPTVTGCALPAEVGQFQALN